MKQKVLWVFSMVLWFLIFSTFFSLRVEQWMTPVVTECIPKTSQNSTKAELELDCLFTDEELPVLYQTYEGMDWNEGLRVKLVEATGYTVLEDSIQCGALDRVIQYATRDLKIGEKVTILDVTEKREDIYLVICPTGVRLQENVPESVEILGQTGNSLLAKDSEAWQVFMPKQAVGRLFQRQPFTMPDERAYSLADVDDFFSVLPLVALLPGTMIFTLLLWLFSFSLLKNSKKNQSRLALNGGFAAAALLVLLLLLHFLQFPSSLLPKDSIVDISHYLQEFTEVFDAVRIFAEAGVHEAQVSLSYANSMLWLALGVVFLCVLLGITVTWAENRLCKS